MSICNVCKLNNDITREHECAACGQMYNKHFELAESYASGPDMLEALELIETMSMGVSAGIKKVARAAIAKAKGKGK